MPSTPALFLSHGSPMLALEENEAHRFLKGFGAQLGKPRAILSVSAHWETQIPVVSLAETPETIHDFGGFPQALFDMRYPAPGSPEVSERAGRLLLEAGFDVRAHPSRGLDHGSWVPLSLMYPQADVPVAQLSIQPDESPEHHYRLGQALRPLRDEGVLILASGSLTHNLRALFSTRREGLIEAPDWVVRFGDWMAEAVAEQRVDDLLNYRSRAPFAAENHPTDEHLLPLFVALGAGSPGTAGVPVHRSHTYGVLAMDAYAFS
ncbi:class III extradiol ring-cleavage dioxygenase [Azospirillum sp. SYSU D00513]|uniref:DODA-type extradiol aromatic ring-opening family dioxygenase n=1 Tax=Azospirillum sp. SYSU D00513 TaxID=2812561 RepID=UPI001A956C36|nr:class III extradiol ring-cleavage dioxygenase [Azospirillum sp. SYSU D00513]